MNEEQKVQAIEQAVTQLDEAMSELSALRFQTEQEIERLTSLKAELTKLLPPEKRLERLFH